MTDRNATNEEIWHDILTNPDSQFHKYRFRKHIPGNPRCKLCKVPLGGIATPLLKLTRMGPSSGNPRFCNACEVWARDHPGGAEIELTLLFADIRGSTHLAEELGPTKFATTVQRFYRASAEVFIDSDAFVDKPVGDEVIALYFPLWGLDHATKAVMAAQKLLIATGHNDSGGPWVPVGVGVHTGTVYVGTVGVEGTVDYNITALGDAVNVTARLASVASAGEILVTDDAYQAAGLDVEDLERRTLELRGREAPMNVRVLTIAPVRV